MNNYEDRKLIPMPVPKPYNKMTDEDIIYYIDNELFTLYQLEKTVGAKKNQLRNRYNRTKRLSAIQKN